MNAIVKPTSFRDYAILQEELSNASSRGQRKALNRAYRAKQNAYRVFCAQQRNIARRSLPGANAGFKKEARIYVPLGDIPVVGVTILKKRGWTEKTIEKHLGEPYAMGINKYNPKGPRTRLWLISLVIAAEQQEPSLLRKPPCAKH